MARIDRTAFAKALHEAHEREHDQRWQDAIDVYADLLASLDPSADPERRAMRAIALMRRGNALMELRRWDEARGALDEALHDAKASGDRAATTANARRPSSSTPSSASIGTMPWPPSRAAAGRS